jgi:uncharacterized membrane protein
MPYCSHCGTQVGDRDAFCAKCGGSQPVSPARPKDFLGDLPPRTAALLCYIPVVGWVPALVVLAAERFRMDRTTRFHAFQGLYLFVTWLVVDWVVGPMSRSFGPAMRVLSLAAILKVFVFIGWIYMIIKVSHNETYKLPFLGELAERSVSEQR